jgi:tight adherence protein B
MLTVDPIIPALALLVVCLMAAARLARSPLRAAFERERAWWAFHFERLALDTRHAHRSAIAFLLFVLVACLATALLAPSPILAVAAPPALWTARHALAAQRWRRRRDRIQQQLPEALRAIASAVNSGLSLPQAIDNAARSVPDPVRVELRIMSSRYALGDDLSTVIEAARERLQLPDFNLFATALQVGRSMGGDIGLVLNRIANAVESVQLMRGKVRAATAHGRTNLKFLAAAPFLMLAIINVIDPEGVALLFSTPLGWLFLSVAVAMCVSGFLWARRLIRVEV